MVTYPGTPMWEIHSTQLDELQPFVFHISDLRLGQQDSSFQCEGRDVGGDFARVLLRLQCQDNAFVGVGDEPEGRKAVGGEQPSDPGHRDVAEIGCAGQEKVGGAVLVSRFLVALRAGTAWEEEPVLSTLAPHCWLVYHVTWKGQGGQELQLVGFGVHFFFSARPECLEQKPISTHLYDRGETMGFRDNCLHQFLHLFQWPILYALHSSYTVVYLHTV